MVGDRVHRAHRQPRTVDDAPDVAVERDVVQVVTARLDLLRVLLVEVAQLRDLALAEQRVVVEPDLAVERNQVAVVGDHEGIDLGLQGVLVTEQPVEPLQDLDEGAHPVLEPDRHRELAALEVEQSGRRIDDLLVDLLRVLGGDLLDVHAALARGDHDDPLAHAVDHQPEVDLAIDPRRALDQHALDQLTPFAGLVGHELVADHLVGDPADLLDRIHELHPARLAPPAGVHLGLHDPAVAADVLGHARRGLARVRDLAGRDRHPVGREQFLGLVLVDVHRSPRSAVGRSAGAPAPAASGRYRARSCSTFAIRFSAMRIDAASISRPSSDTAPLPCFAASSIASRIRRARSTSSSLGEKTSFASATCFGWIAHLPSQPSAAARRAAER